MMLTTMLMAINMMMYTLIMMILMSHRHEHLMMIIWDIDMDIEDAQYDDNNMVIMTLVFIMHSIPIVIDMKIWSCC